MMKINRNNIGIKARVLLLLLMFVIIFIIGCVQ